MTWWQTVTATLPALAILAGFAAWFVRTVVRESHAALLTEMEARYTRSMQSTLTGAQIERELAELRAELKTQAARSAELHQYTHGRAHDLNGAAMKHEGKLGELSADLATVRGELAVLNQYAHVSVHDLEGDMAGVRMLLEVLRAADRASKE